MENIGCSFKFYGSDLNAEYGWISQKPSIVLAHFPYILLEGVSTQLLRMLGREKMVGQLGHFARFLKESSLLEGSVSVQMVLSSNGFVNLSTHP